MNKSLVPPLTLLLSLLALLGTSALGDTIASVDKAAGLITVETSAGLKSYRLKPFTEVKLNGTATTLDNLSPGMKVEMGLGDAQTAVRIRATGNAPSGFGAPTPRPPLDDASQSNNHKITIRGKIDNDMVKVREGTVWLEHGAFDFPTGLTINGVPWKPQWKEKLSERFNAFHPPLAPFGESKVEVKKMSGRIEIRDLIPPTEANDHTLSFRIIDAPPGVAESEVRITW
ncbi:MAG: hypothetical protein WDN28_16205 [Chthoniobacter sp.]